MSMQDTADGFREIGDEYAAELIEKLIKQGAKSSEGVLVEENGDLVSIGEDD